MNRTCLYLSLAQWAGLDFDGHAVQDSDYIKAVYDRTGCLVGFNVFSEPQLEDPRVQYLREACDAEVEREGFTVWGRWTTAEERATAEGLEDLRKLTAYAARHCGPEWISKSSVDWAIAELERARWAREAAEDARTLAKHGLAEDARTLGELELLREQTPFHLRTPAQRAVTFDDWPVSAKDTASAAYFERCAERWAARLDRAAVEVGLLREHPMKITDANIGVIERNPRLFAPRNPSYVKSHKNSYSRHGSCDCPAGQGKACTTQAAECDARGQRNGKLTVRSWFRQMRAEDFEKHLRDVTMVRAFGTVYSPPWNLLDSQKVVDRVTAPHYVADRLPPHLRHLWQLDDAWALMDRALEIYNGVLRERVRRDQLGGQGA